MNLQFPEDKTINTKYGDFYIHFGDSNSKIEFNQIVGYGGAWYKFPAIKIYCNNFWFEDKKRLQKYRYYFEYNFFVCPKNWSSHNVQFELKEYDLHGGGYFYKNNSHVISSNEKKYLFKILLNLLSSEEIQKNFKISCLKQEELELNKKEISISKNMIHLANEMLALQNLKQQFQKKLSQLINSL